jgi:uncharacterized protein (TIGR02145 family)
MPNVGDLIASVSYKNGYIRFSTPEIFRDGNALIAARNSNGTILWSWHIWCAEDGWGEQVYYNDAGIMMDRNLGATSATPGDVGALGLMYQWGRKDPFMGPSSIWSSVQAASTGTWSIIRSQYPNVVLPAAKAETNPTTFYTSTFLPNGSWLSTKTAYDPCPIGWRVPDGGENGVWAKAIGTSSLGSLSFDRTNIGINFTGVFAETDTIWYPASGYISGGSGELFAVSSQGHYWSCSTYELEHDDAYCLYFYNNGDLSPTWYYYQRSDCKSVRCLKDVTGETGPADFGSNMEYIDNAKPEQKW